MEQNPNVQDLMKKFPLKGGFFRSVILFLLVVLLLLTSWFTIGPEEVGVILRLGKYNRTVYSGLHFKIPFGMEEIFKVPIERQLKQEFGFRTLKSGINTSFSSKSYNEEAVMLTGDLNVAVVEWIVQYRVKDPYRYLFKVRNPNQTLRDMTEATMRNVIGDRSVNEVLTVGRQEISTEVESMLQILCEQYETGIRIDQVVLQDVTPPEKVKPSFNEVNEAQQDREKLINQAMSQYNQVIPKAKGEARQTIEVAEGYALDRVNRAKGEANRFLSLFEEYNKAKDITKKRLYLETMNIVLPKAGQKYIIDKDASGVLPLLQLDK
ncbi:MAG TPA: FtsH protease activity modulator HflK [Candidatus Marinimicrobia bacterium]|nr:FtsH protease activity modulator HflK [Candidatus Neomarinimicrobiota bacterium]